MVVYALFILVIYSHAALARRQFILRRSYLEVAGRVPPGPPYRADSPSTTGSHSFPEHALSGALTERTSSIREILMSPLIREHFSSLRYRAFPAIRENSASIPISLEYLLSFIANVSEIGLDLNCETRGETRRAIFLRLGVRIFITFTSDPLLTTLRQASFYAAGRHSRVNYARARGQLSAVRNNRSNRGVNQGASFAVATLFMEHHRRENCPGESRDDVP